jgi:dihydroneopterin aldolase
MATIALEGMEFYAYHGCFKEEQVIGALFLVDLELDADTSAAEASDHLADTLNYQEAYVIVKQEMEQKSNLIEHVARRILDAVGKAFPQARRIRIRVTKTNPPVGGKVRTVSCVLEH